MRNSSSDSPAFGPSGRGPSVSPSGDSFGLPGPEEDGAGIDAGLADCEEVCAGALAENWSSTSAAVSISLPVHKLLSPSRSSKSGSESSAVLTVSATLDGGVVTVSLVVLASAGSALLSAMIAISLGLVSLRSCI